MAAVTALQALRDKGNIQKGHEVLILGSGGGIGTFAVQMAKYFGTTVTGVCSTKNVEQTILLGADYVIDYTKENFTGSNRSYDIILAVNGNYPLSTCRRILKPNGRYVMVGGALSQIAKAILLGWVLSFGTRKMSFLAAKARQKDLELIVKLAGESRIKPVIDKRYSLDKAAEAIRYVASGHARGKAIVTI